MFKTYYMLAVFVSLKHTHTKPKQKKTQPKKNPKPNQSNNKKNPTTVTFVLYVHFCPA